MGHPPIKLKIKSLNGVINSYNITSMKYKSMKQNLYHNNPFVTNIYHRRL
jgi:hypothetical protein